MLTLKTLVYLEAEINEEIEGLSRICSILQNKGFFDESSARQKILDEVVLRGAAGMIQDYYSGVERIFKRIAAEIDERLPKGENWHKSLLDQMKIEVPGVRPRVISKTTYSKLDDLRSFRHKVGNIYGFNLIPERVLAHLLALPELDASFRNDVRTFLQEMKSILKDRIVKEKLENTGKPKLTF
jgi:hypothetical protein